MGEGGYVVPPARFLRELRALCDETGILLVADEIQSGIGRTGKFFAVEHFDVVPDVMTIAKGIASGLPLSGVITRQAAGGEVAHRHPRGHLRRQCGGVCSRRGDRAGDQGRKPAGERGQRAASNCSAACASSRPNSPSSVMCAGWG